MVVLELLLILAAHALSNPERCVYLLPAVSDSVCRTLFSSDATQTATANPTHRSETTITWHDESGMS